MLSAALAKTSAGTTIRYRTDGRFFDLRRLKANTKVQEALVRDFLFADDSAVASHSEEDLQCLADCFSIAAKAFGLTISIKKTEVLCQAAPEPSAKIDGAALKNVEDFTYLGSCPSSSGGLDTEISRRLSKASSAFGRLWTRVWPERGTTQATKLAVYRAVVLPALLYGCETWTCYRRHLKKLDHFHLRSLRRLLGISSEDRVTKQDVFFRRPACQVLSSFSWRPNSDGLATRWEWRTAVFQNRSSTLNWLTALAGRVAKQSATKTPPRTVCAPVTSLLKAGSILQ